MDATTVVIAALGFASTLSAAWLTARWQDRGSRQARLFDLKVQVYGECAQHLFEYERATVNRVKARLADQPEATRVDLRQEAYQNSARVRATLGRVALLGDSPDLRLQCEEAKQFVGDMTGVHDQAALTTLHVEAVERINQVMESARADLKVGA